MWRPIADYHENMGPVLARDELKHPFVVQLQEGRFLTIPRVPTYNGDNEWGNLTINAIEFMEIPK
jgi:hypothetical protein